MQCCLLQFSFSLGNSILHCLVNFLFQSLQRSNCIVVDRSCFLAGKFQCFFLGFIIRNTIPVVFQCSFSPFQIPLGAINSRLSFGNRIVIVFFCLGLLIFPLLLGIGILCIGIPYRKLLFFHVLFLLQNHFVQIVKIQNKQNITLLYLLAFIDANAGNSQATNRGYCQLLVLNGFASDLHSMVDGSAGRHFRGHHSRTMLINSSGKNGEKNHRPEEQSDPLPNAYLFFFQVHN